MSKGTHIVGKNTLRLEIEEGLDAFAIQQEISWILRQRIIPQLEKLFDELAPDKVYWRIDTLEIFLDELDPEQLETELTDRVIEAIRDSLLHEQIFSEIPSPLVSTKISPSKAHVDALIYFLTEGVLPWWYSQKPLREWENELLQAFNINPSVVHPVLTLLEQHKISRNRLLWQFSQELWESLFKFQNSSLHTDILAYKSLFLHKLPKLIEAAIPYKKISSTEFWQFLLQHLGEIRGQSKLEKSVVSSLLNEIIPVTSKNIDSLRIIFEQLLTNRSAEVPSDQLAILKEWFKGKIDLQANTPLIDLGQDSDNQGDEKAKENLSGTFQPNSSAHKLTFNPNLRNRQSNSITSSEPTSQHHISENGLFVNNAGIIILHPFLSTIFEELGYISKKTFKNEEAQFRAIHLLQYLANGELDAPEYDLVLNKILCGLPTHAPIPRELELSEAEKTEADHLLKVALGYWKALKSTSIDGLRFNYFMREGKLLTRHESWKLQVEAKTQDILLNKLPWGIGMIQSSWMKQRLDVEWAY